MAIDLVKSREEVLSPSAPCIIKNLAQVEGGVEIYVSSEYVAKYGNVLKAGHLVVLDYTMSNSAYGVDGNGKFSDDVAGNYDAPGCLGVVTSDAVIYKNGVDYFASVSVMVAGVVDAEKLPFRLPHAEIKETIKAFATNGIVFLNLKTEE